MAVLRQEKSPETGRVNQKRRTRAALVEAGKRLLREGITPTVAQAAEAALVSRTTAYRYFPTQESLLVELSVNLELGDIEELVAQPPDSDEAVDRAVEVIDEMNRQVHAHEAQYRTAIRLYQQQWLEARAGGTETPLVREGRRARWLEASLAPLAETVPKAEWDRVVRAISMLIGAEAMVVLRDIWQLDDEEARAVSAWAARTLLDATFDSTGDDS